MESTKSHGLEAAREAAMLSDAGSRPLQVRQRDGHRAGQPERRQWRLVIEGIK